MLIKRFWHWYENLEDEDGIGVEKYWSEPKGVDVVEAGEHHLLVDVEPGWGGKMCEWRVGGEIRKMCQLDWRESHRCRMLIVLTDSVLLSNWSWRRPSERLGASTNWKREFVSIENLRSIFIFYLLEIGLYLLEIGVVESLLRPKWYLSFHLLIVCVDIWFCDSCIQCDWHIKI